MDDEFSLKERIKFIEQHVYDSNQKINKMISYYNYYEIAKIIADIKIFMSEVNYNVHSVKDNFSKISKDIDMLQNNMENIIFIQKELKDSLNNINRRMNILEEEIEIMQSDISEG